MLRLSFIIPFMSAGLIHAQNSIQQQQQQRKWYVLCAPSFIYIFNPCNEWDLTNSKRYYIFLPLSIGRYAMCGILDAASKERLSIKKKNQIVTF